MSKKVRHDELITLIRECFRASLPSKIHPKNGIEVILNSIYAKIIYDFEKNGILIQEVEDILDNFKKILEKYAGDNLLPVKLNDEIIIQVKYEILN